ncbi:GNAT family N-acetyltransferase (plasmid) [Streptomyces sp. BI20]|uniref:GNAT family N-acetyltransferase n=1 Tax=Streptomyces sp. BI20 TaxID=3403460 RepID=UPI003C790FE4
MQLHVAPADAESAHVERTVWTAVDPASGAVLGTADLRLFTDQGRRGLAETDVRVEAPHRRAGVGDRLLGAVIDAARADGRRTLAAGADADSPGLAFLTARGFRPVLTLRHARLDLAAVEPDSLALASLAAPGYLVVAWSERVPEALLDAFVAARAAMDDMPVGEAEAGPLAWDRARIRAVEQAVLLRGEHLRVVAALDLPTDRAGVRGEAEAGGRMVGFSELVVPASGSGDAEHYGTAVLPEHRGRGVARRLKAEAIVRTIAEFPEVSGLLTDTAEENTAMRRVNAALGYAPTHTTLRLELPL